MTRQEVAELFDRVHRELAELREAGQKEYAHDETNAFANFERIGVRLGVGRDVVLLVYLLKHIDGITAYVKGHKSQREDVRGRIKDAIVYLHLLYGMVEEDDTPEGRRFSDGRIERVVEGVGCTHAEVEVYYKGTAYYTRCTRCHKILTEGNYLTGAEASEVATKSPY